MFNTIMIGFNLGDSDFEGEISMYSDPCLCPLGLSVIFIIVVLGIIAVLCAYFLLKLKQKWKIYLFADRHNSRNLASFRSELLPEGRETDLLFLKLFDQWMQGVLNRNPTPRQANRNIYSIMWGRAKLTQAEKTRLHNISVNADVNGSLRALGYRVDMHERKIRAIDSNRFAKSGIALLTVLAANDR